MKEKEPLGPEEIPKDLLSISHTTEAILAFLDLRIHRDSLSSLVFIVPRRPTSYTAKTTKEKKSWGILARGCLFSLARCTRSILWPRAKHTVEPYKHFIPVGALSFTMNGEQSPLMQKKKRRSRRRSKRCRCEICLRERVAISFTAVFSGRKRAIPIVQ